MLRVLFAQAGHSTMDKRKDCWSYGPSSDSTRLVPRVSFFVSSDVLRQLAEEFGPGRNSGNTINIHRYGWELIRTLLGPERLRRDTEAGKRSGLGVVGLLRNIEPDGIDLFGDVLKHSRQLFGETVTDKSRGSPGRFAFLGYCHNHLGSLRRKKDNFGIPPPLRIRSTSCETEKKKVEVAEERHSEEIPEPARRIQPKRAKRDWEDLDEDSAAFLRETKASEADIRKMMEDETLKAEVESLVGIDKALMALHEPHQSSFSFRLDGDLAEIHQTDLAQTIHMPISQVRDGYTKSKLKSGGRAFFCNFCEEKLFEEEDMQAHVARRHYLRSLSLEGFHSKKAKTTHE